MSDPAIEAAKRVHGYAMFPYLSTDLEAAAREMAKPIRELYGHWMRSPSSAITSSLEVQEMLKELARLIFSSEELGDKE